MGYFVGKLRLTQRNLTPYPLLTITNTLVKEAHDKQILKEFLDVICRFTPRYPSATRWLLHC